MRCGRRLGASWDSAWPALRVGARAERRAAALACVPPLASALVVMAACGSGTEPSEPPPLTTVASPRDAARAPDPTLEASTTIESKPSAATYVGTLDATRAVTFGGSPYCEYSVTLRDVRLEVASLETGEILAAAARDLMVEATVPPCAHDPLAPSSQTFALTTATKTATGASLAFEGAKTNRPGTTLVVELTRNGDAWDASATWTRNDVQPPLDWQIKAKISLAKR